MQLRRIVWAIILVMSVAIYWLTGRSPKHESDVEFVPTPEPVVIEMLKMAGVTKEDVVYDLGCGDGRIVNTAAKIFGAQGVGVDVDRALVRLSNKNAQRMGVTKRVKFIEGDLFQTNLSKATVVSLYLTPELNVRLRPKFFQELKAGTRILSHDFNMGDWKPDNMGRVPNVTHHYPDRTYARDAPFYYWIIPANVSGTWRWTISAPTGKRDYTLHLVQKFQEISGDMNVVGRACPIADSRLAGNQLSFTLHDAADREKSTIWFNGRVNGDTVEGNLEILGGPDAGNYNWIAKRRS